MHYQNYHTMRQSLGTPRIIRNLILVNIVVFIVQGLFSREFEYLFGLVPVLVTQKFYIWQFVTYMFLHGGFMHILFNMFALYMFGRDLVGVWGEKRFIEYYFITGIGAGIINYLFIMEKAIPTIGASGAIYGILVAYAMYFPRRKLYLYFMFPIEARILVLVFAFIEFFATLKNADGVAHFAHLGGLVIGYLVIKFVYHKRVDLFGDLKKYFNFGKKTINFHNMKEEQLKVLERRVNEILDKTRTYGWNSLTMNEREILRRASIIFNRNFFQDDL